MTSLILPVLQGKNDLVFLLEQASQIGFSPASHPSDEALQQALRRDTGYRAEKLEVLGSLETPEKVEVVIASDLTWAPLPLEQPIRTHTRKLTDALIQSREGEHFNQMAAQALFMYAHSREEQS